MRQAERERKRVISEDDTKFDVPPILGCGKSEKNGKQDRERGKKGSFRVPFFRSMRVLGDYRNARSEHERISSARRELDIFRYDLSWIRDVSFGKWKKRTRGGARARTCGRNIAVSAFERYEIHQ